MRAQKHSLRNEPMNRSAYGFCHGDLGCPSRKFNLARCSFCLDPTLQISSPFPELTSMALPGSTLQFPARAFSLAVRFATQLSKVAATSTPISVYGLKTPLLAKVNASPPVPRQLKGWLKAGVMEGGELFPTEEGVMQGHCWLTSRYTGLRLQLSPASHDGTHRSWCVTPTIS